MMIQNFTDTTVTDKKLAEVISASPMKTITDVIAVMEEMDKALPNHDGLKWFNLMYLKVTLSVQNTPPAEGWENRVYMERLTVVFAGLYFSAVASWQRSRDSVVRSWSPVFLSRVRKGIARIQFAVAGMNAHINHDLSLALVQTSGEQRIIPRRGSPEHRDFERVNTLLGKESEKVKQFLATGIIGVVDETMGRADDNVALWSIGKARDTAFTNAEILWKLRRIPSLNDAFIRNLDRLVGLSSRGLLSPSGI